MNKIKLLTLVTCASISGGVFAQATLEDTIAAKLDAFDSPSSTPTARPRLLKGNPDGYGIVPAALKERKVGLTNLARVVADDYPIKSKQTLVDNFNSTTESIHDGALDGARRELEGALEAAFAFHVLGNVKYLNELEARIAAFAPKIITDRCNEKAGYITAQRDYVFNLAAAYDLVRDRAAIEKGEKLSELSRQRIFDVVAHCSSHANITGLLTSVPKAEYDGTVFNTLVRVMAGQLLLRKDPEFEARLTAIHPDFNRTWLRDALKVWAGRMPNWGGDDGGYANGSSYMLWDTNAQALGWDVIDRVLGFPMYTDEANKAAQYVNNLPEFLLFTQPPGAPRGAFGDGAEIARYPEEVSRVGKSLMNRLFSNITRWYVKDANTVGEDTARIDTLLSPRENSADATLVEPTSSSHLSAAFPSVGIAAFHSTLTDPKRLSILFRGSNKFGSANHAHPDMNSFVIYDQGEVLASDSGVYDEYNSDHRVYYAKTTKAHNAITFDEGKGQKDATLVTNEKQSWGYRYADNVAPIVVNPGAVRAPYSNAITASQFTTKGKRYDIVSSDVGYAYNGELSKSKRTLVYLRPDTIVVVDQLASGTVNNVRPARTWEWNLHTAAGRNGSATANGGLGVSIGAGSMCVQVASYQNGQNGMVLQDQRTGYPIAPTSADKGPAHFWQVWKSAAKSTDTTIVSVLRTDCATNAWSIGGSIQFSATHAAKVTVDGVLVDISATAVLVKDAP